MQDITYFINLHPYLSLATLIVFVLVFIVELMRAKRKHASLSPAQLTQMINHENAIIFDIRASESFRKGHIIDALSISRDDMDQHPKKLEKYKTRPIIIICSNGLESQKVAASLVKQGYQATSLGGGIRSWADAQMPLIKE